MADTPENVEVDLGAVDVPAPSDQIEPSVADDAILNSSSEPAPQMCGGITPGPILGVIFLLVRKIMANQVIIGALFQEETSQVRLPYFNGQHISHWKVHMEIYAKTYDVKVWRVIKKGNYPLPAATPPLADPEDIDSYTKEQMEVIQVNNIARNLLCNAISGEEYEKISSCDTTKEMWDKFEVTYEGTNKVKETHINMLVHDYKLFSMKEGESIEEIDFNKNKSFGSWSDEDSSEHEEISNLCFMMILENEMNKSSGCWTDEDTSDDEYKDDNENCFMARGETSEVRSYNCERCNELQDILDLTLKEYQKMMNELKRLNKEIKDWKLKHEVCEIEKEVLQEEFGELQMQLNGMCKSTSHSSVRSNQMTYKSTGKGLDEFGNQKIILNLVILTLQDLSKLGYLKESNHYILKEYHRISRKGKWYLDNACSNHMIDDKNLLKEITKIDGGSVMFGDDSKEKIIGTGTIPFNNNCDITEVYLVDGLNYNLLSISQLCDLGYEVNFKKIGIAIEDETGKTVLSGKRYGHVYFLDHFEKIDGHICLTSMSDDPWL
ncbi:uncharacterized protein [Nicotiana sylvestris]|uniref:uncharacterized protein n=1 Tax=Nicotiana sylvestris TaxID=4096 RepID=UPI00388C9744